MRLGVQGGAASRIGVHKPSKAEGRLTYFEHETREFKTTSTVGQNVLNTEAKKEWTLTRKRVDGYLGIRLLWLSRVSEG